MRMISYLAPGYPPELFDAIARHVGAEVAFVEGRSGPDPDDDPFATGLADVGWVCSTSLVELTTARRPSVREVGVAWVPDDPDASGRPVYFSDVVVRRDSDTTSLADLAGRRIGCNDPASLSGYHALRIELDRRGQRASDFAQLVMTGAHHQSLDRVLSGDLDAAVVDSIVRRRRARHDPAVAPLEVVERLGPWPTQPVVMRAGATDSEVSALRDELLSVNDSGIVTSLLAESSLVRLAATNADHCDPVRDAMHRLGARSTT